LFTLGFFYSCKEVGPYINFNPNHVDSSLLDTTYINATAEMPQLKNVLIEDFTGVRCSNCPKAADEIHTLDSLNPGRVVPIAYHVGIFSNPFSGSKQDFRTADGSALFSLFGQGPQPTGDVDRVNFTGTGVLINYNVWGSYLSQRLAIQTPVNISISRVYRQDSSNVLKVRVTVSYTQASTDTNYLTVALIENNIIDLQELPTTQIDSFYHLDHVFRAFLTPYNGILLKAPLVIKRVFIKEFKIPIKPNWNDNNCYIVAFVNKFSTKYDVLQIQQIKIR